MLRSAPSPDLHRLIEEADAAARRVHFKLRLPPADRDDLRQELLVDALRRLRDFDPERGNLGAFAGAVMRHQASRIAARTMRDRRRQGGAMLSTDALTDRGQPLGETLSDGPYTGWASARVEHRLDLASALSRLDRHERALCAGVMLFSIDQLVAYGLGSRASLYRRLHDLRGTLAAHGLQVAA